MATDFTEETAADAVVDSFAQTPDPRLRELLSSLVRHLHVFVRETEPTIAEWERAIDFLTATGQKCDDERQEFILLSDVLGISMLVETINNRKTGGATESTVLGPFHMIESPRRELGECIDFVGTGTPCVVTGRVLSADGAPLPGAELDVWQANDQGFYDVQQPGVSRDQQVSIPRFRHASHGGARADRLHVPVVVAKHSDISADPQDAVLREPEENDLHTRFVKRMNRDF